MRGFTGARAPRLKVTSARQPRVSPEKVVQGFDGTPVGRLEGQVNPGDLLAIRDVLAARLKSSGGRPALDGAEKHKVPVLNEDWEKLARVAEEVRHQWGISATAAQVCGAAIHVACQRLTDEDIADGIAAMAG